MAILTFLPALFGYEIWTIGSIIWGIILLLVFVLIYKNTSKGFTRFSKGKTIATIILYSMFIFIEIYNHIVAGSVEIVGLSVFFQFLLLFAGIFHLGVGFYSIHLFVSSIITIYNTIKKKLYKRNKKEFTLSWIYVLVLNGFSASIIFFLLLVGVSTALTPALYGEPCGVHIGEIIPSSGAYDAGMKSGEIIIEINGDKINTGDDLVASLEAHKPGDSISVTTNTTKYTVTLGSQIEENSRAFLGVDKLKIPRCK